MCLLVVVRGWKVVLRMRISGMPAGIHPLLDTLLYPTHQPAEQHIQAGFRPADRRAAAVLQPGAGLGLPVLAHRRLLMYDVLC